MTATIDQEKFTVIVRYDGGNVRETIYYADAEWGWHGIKEFLLGNGYAVVGPLNGTLTRSVRFV